jgi:hypothetical protein
MTEVVRNNAALLGRGVAAWDRSAARRLDHLAEYRSSRVCMIRAADRAVDTGCRTPAEIAHQIAALPEP